MTGVHITLSSLRSTGKRINLQWIPNKVGICRNEMVDNVARKATKFGSVPELILSVDTV